MFLYSEKGLWELLQFAVFNKKAIEDATGSLDYLLERDCQIVYMVDFSDIHPFMYPEKSYKYFDSEMPLHGKSVVKLWSSIMSMDKSNMDFKFVLPPAAKLEVFESLRHCKCRVEKELSRIIPLKVLEGNENDIWEFLTSPGFRNIDIEDSFEDIIGHHSITEGVRKPAQRFIDLYKNSFFYKLEQVLPKEMLTQVQHNAPDAPDKKAKDTLKNFFQENPRRNERPDLYAIRHNNFHDAIDLYNILFAHDLINISRESFRQIYTPFITHTNRVISASRRIEVEAGNPTIVQHSIAP